MSATPKLIRGLLIETSNGETHWLPYGHLLHARHSTGNDFEQIELMFATHDVSFRGEGLGKLLSSVGDQTVEILSVSEKDGQRIDAIDVQYRHAEQK
jgi:hypothetical protein